MSGLTYYANTQSNAGRTVLSAKHPEQGLQGQTRWVYGLSTALSVSQKAQSTIRRSGALATLKALSWRLFSWVCAGRAGGALGSVFSYKVKAIAHWRNFIIKGASCLLLVLSLSISQGVLAATCKGHFVNPITDVCWDCIFPITIGSIPVAPGDYPDTTNPKSPISMCRAPAPVFFRPGINIGFWEPFALVDVTRDPYCMVNMGIKLSVKNQGLGGSEMPSADGRGAFYFVHWYKYPLIYWLQIITSIGCVQTGEFDLAYLSELDPTWNDDELGFVLNPEATLFSNPITQMACAADSLKTSIDSQSAIDALFWCMGSNGSTYPLTGNISNQTSPIEAATLEAERMDFKMHREGLIWDTTGAGWTLMDPPVCHQYPSPIMPKSRYRYQLVNTIPDARQCHPFGHLVGTWETGHVNPADGDNFGFLIFKKRNCAFL